MVDVPLHVTNPTVIEQNVRVEGGTNWDLSRSAVPTPIQRLPDPEPYRTNESTAYAAKLKQLPAYTALDGIPASTPTSQLFASGKALISKEAQKELRALNKKVAYVVVGHAEQGEASPSKLSWARANNVAALLRKSGHKVSVVKAFGAERPASDTGSFNRRVEVYPAGGLK